MTVADHTVPCGHWRACGIVGGGCCGLELYGPRVSFGTCAMVCPHGRAAGATPPPGPPDPAGGIEAAGRRLWAELHRAALAGTLTAEWLRTFTARVPCGECKRHWREILSAIPFRPADQFAWSVSVHAAVSRRLGKDEVSIEDARRIWSAPA